MATDPFPADPLPRFRATDLSLLAGLIVTAPLSWITPEPFWKIYTVLGALLKACLSFKRTRASIRHIELIFGGSIGTFEAALIEIRVSAGNIERNFQYFREFSPAGWQPQIRVVGREHLDRALKAGRGGILWVAPFLFNQLVVKKGLRESGVAISHLGAFPHGQSVTRFGVRFINPIRAIPENSYLHERIIISPPGGKLGYIRKVEQRLRENRLVSITCRQLAQKIIELPILNGRVPLATGAPSFAVATGAALLPVFTIRKASGTFEIIIEPPLDAPETKNRDDAVMLLAHKYARLMESYLVKFPDLFIYWSALRKVRKHLTAKGNYQKATHA